MKFQATILTTIFSASVALFVACGDGSKDKKDGSELDAAYTRSATASCAPGYDKVGNTCLSKCPADMVREADIRGGFVCRKDAIYSPPSLGQRVTYGSNELFERNPWKRCKAGERFLHAVPFGVVCAKHSQCSSGRERVDTNYCSVKCEVNTGKGNLALDRVDAHRCRVKQEKVTYTCPSTKDRLQGTTCQREIND